MTAYDRWLEPPDDPPQVECDECAGTGSVPDIDWDEDLQRSVPAKCRVCDGTGSVDAPEPDPDRDDLHDGHDDPREDAFDDRY